MSFLNNQFYSKYSSLDIHKHFLKEFKKDYNNRSPLLLKMIQRSKAKKKQPILHADELEKGGSIAARIKEYFNEREFRIMQLLGDDKDSYDKLLDLVPLDEDPKDAARKIRKFQFVDSAPAIDYYKKHLNKINNIRDKYSKIKSNSLNSLCRELDNNRSKVDITRKKNDFPQLTKSSSAAYINKEHLPDIKQIIGNEADVYLKGNTNNEEECNVLAVNFIKQPPTILQNKKKKSFQSFLFQKSCMHNICNYETDIGKACRDIQTKNDMQEELKKEKRKLFEQRVKVLLRRLDLERNGGKKKRE